MLCISHHPSSNTDNLHWISLFNVSIFLELNIVSAWCTTYLLKTKKTSLADYLCSETKKGPLSYTATKNMVFHKSIILLLFVVLFHEGDSHSWVSCPRYMFCDMFSDITDDLIFPSSTTNFDNSAMLEYVICVTQWVSLCVALVSLTSVAGFSSVILPRSQEAGCSKAD